MSARADGATPRTRTGGAVRLDAAGCRLVLRCCLLLAGLLLASTAVAAGCAFEPPDYEVRRAGDSAFTPLGERLTLPPAQAVETVEVRFVLPPSDRECWLIVDRVAMLSMTIRVAGEPERFFDFFRPHESAQYSAAGFVVPLSPHAEAREVILSVNKLGVVATRAQRVDLDGLLTRERGIGMLHGLSVLAPVFMLLLVLPFWIKLRDQALAAYMALLGSLMLGTASLDGSLYLVPLLRELAVLKSMTHVLMVSLFGLAAVQFFRTFLAPLDASGQWTVRILSGWFAFTALGSLVWLPVFSAAIQHLVSLGLLVTVPALFWQGWRSWRAGHPSAGYFLVGWALPLSVLPLRVVAEYGGLDWRLGFRYAPRFAFMFESIVFALGLADRLRRVYLERDRAEQAQARSERDLQVYRRLAEGDALTGLASRRALDSALQAWDNNGQQGTVLFIDLDQFKDFNDRFGHAAGDQALREVAAQLRRVLPAEALKARYGGEELVALLPDTGLDAGLACAETLRQAISTGVGDPEGMPISVSIGVAERHPQEAVRDTLVRADTALYRAKAAGRNRVERD